MDTFPRPQGVSESLRKFGGKLFPNPQDIRSHVITALFPSLSWAAYIMNIKSQKWLLEEPDIDKWLSAILVAERSD
jgi:hypothetical protein